MARPRKQVMQQQQVTEDIILSEDIINESSQKLILETNEPSGELLTDEIVTTEDVAKEHENKSQQEQPKTFKNTSANRYDFKIVQFEAGEVKELTETELNDSRIKYAIELGILEAQ